MGFAMHTSVGTGFIACSALGREIKRIIQRNGWDAGLISVPAEYHLSPQHIAPAVETLILCNRERYRRLVVVYGDCGTRGQLDRVLERYGISRIPAPHCYAMFAGRQFHDLAGEESGTYFLTDYLVSIFFDRVIPGLGLDHFPELKSDYFRHFTRLVYLAQEEDPRLQERAQAIALYLDLPLETYVTGCGQLEESLARLVEGQEISGD